MQRLIPHKLFTRLDAGPVLTALIVACGLLVAVSLGSGQTLLAAAGAGVGLVAAGALLRNTAAQWQEGAVPAADHRDRGTYEHAPLEAMQSVIGLLDLPVVALDAGSTVVTYNRAARDLFPSLEAGRQLYQVSRNPGLLDAFQRTRDRGTLESCEISELAFSGRRLIATVAPLRIPGSETPLAGALIQFRDLSEQDRLARLRTDFIANASHELRTPLASIRGFIETLQGPASTDIGAHKKFLGIMEAQAARMTRILDDLLALGRIEMREHLVPTVILDVAPVLRATVEGLEPIAREAKITLTLNAVAGESRVFGDRDELVQVFQNLIQNAIKYGHEGGTVVAALERFPSQAGGLPQVVITITDDGPGIAEEHLPRLTERFYRVDTAASRERGGTGLGLAIVKHILNRHRGELRIASKLGRGSKFTVILGAAP